MEKIWVSEQKSLGGGVLFVRVEGVAEYLARNGKPGLVAGLRDERELTWGIEGDLEPSGCSVRGAFWNFLRDHMPSVQRLGAARSREELETRVENVLAEIEEMSEAEFGRWLGEVPVD